VIKKILFHNFLIVYRTSHWIRKHFTHTGLLFLSGAVAAAVFGIDTRQTLAYQIFALLSCILVVAFITAFIFRSKFNITRILPVYGTVGEKIQYKIILSGQAARTYENITLIDELVSDKPVFNEYLNIRDKLDSKRNIFDRLIGYPRMVSLIHHKCGAFIRPVEIDRIPAGENAEKKIELMPIRRGYLHFNHTFIAKADPFGLFRKLIKVKQPDSLLILPKCYDIPDIMLSGKRKYQHGGMNLASSVGDSEEFFSLRDYRAGDPMRSIHWRSYAKKGEPVVKEYQDEFFSRMAMVLDTFIENNPDYIFEDAVSIAASVVLANKQQDALLDLLFVNNKSYQFTTGRGLAGIESAMEILACVEITNRENFNELGQLILDHVNETSGFIFIFLDWDKKRQELVRELRLLNVPVHVIVISAQEILPHLPDDPMQDRPDYFWTVQTGAIEQSLQKILH
jgi:uncharacterized protein (DUF58 family)